MNFPLLLKHILLSGLRWAPHAPITYRDQTRLTYTELYDRVLHLGAGLQGLGLQPGDRVGVMEWDSHRFLELYFAVPGIGAVLHTINPRLAPADVGYTLRHAGDVVLIVHADFLPLLEKIQADLQAVRWLVVIYETPLTAPIPQLPHLQADVLEYEAFLAGAAPLPELPELDENTPATLAYTTGTTGRPKGMRFTQRQLTLHTLSVGLALSAFTDFGGVTKRDVYMPLTPLFHVHAWGMPFVATLFGLPQVYPGRYEPELILRLAAEHQVTFSHCVPTILQLLLPARQAQAPEFRPDLSRWKLIIGGARLPLGLAQAAHDLGLNLYAGYGLSETAPVLTMAFLQPQMEAWEPERRQAIQVKTGLPIPLVDLQVVDEAGQPVAYDGEQRGEIRVRAPWVAQGYADDPQATQEAWRDGWFYTSDIATRDAYGYVQIVDRMKDMIKSGGEWISSLELENLLSLHPAVAEAAVTGVPDPVWGERPQAYIRLSLQAETLDPAELKQALQIHLRQFVEQGQITPWAVPDQYVFLKELPHTSVGKIDKRALRGL